ncbi:hypothetical protein LENED_003965 [Lentinula edodes]|nr:hypothetical protein LENED_003965 [Lentinula edodes]
MPSAADAWSFNLRNHNLDFSDSDSDFDSGDASSNIAPAFDETKLLNDFDLSTREETVIYKPNPFNIARINAASRAQKFISSAPKPDLLLTSKSGLAKGTIIDCFRLQAQKSKLVAPSTSNDIDIDKPATPLNHHLVKSQNDNTPSSLPSSIPNLSDAKNNGHNKYPVAHIFPHIAPAHKIASAKKHRDTTSRSARTNLKPNPYDSLPMGEGEEWGTLEPAKKKMKPSRENEFGIRTSSKFTLGSLGMDLGKGKKTGMSAESSRRVITFLPPPLDSKSRSLSEDETRSPPPKIVEDAIDLNYTSVQARNFEHDDHDLCASPEHSNVQHHITMVLLGGRAHKSPVTPARKISNPYPSPQVSALSVGDAPRDLEVPSGRRVTAIDKTCSDLYRPPSPPTSDPPQQNETFGRDTSIPLDIGSISRRYPGIQRMSRK